MFRLAVTLSLIGVLVGCPFLCSLEAATSLASEVCGTETPSCSDKVEALSGPGESAGHCGCCEAEPFGSPSRDDCSDCGSCLCLCGGVVYCATNSAGVTAEDDSHTRAGLPVYIGEGIC